MNCASCNKPIDALEAFPGDICVDCYAASPAGQAPISSDELVAMWGGPVRKVINFEESE